MSAVTMRRKNMNRIELIPLRSPANMATGAGGINEGEKRPSTSSSSSRSAKLVEERSSLIRKQPLNDRMAHKKMALSDRATAFPHVSDFRTFGKEEILESVLDKINSLSNHSYFVCGGDLDSSSHPQAEGKTPLVISGKAPSTYSSDSMPSSISQYQRHYIEWKNTKEIAEGTRQIAEAIKRKEHSVPFATFGVFSMGDSVYKNDFVTEEKLKMRKSHIEIEESKSYILNNPWEKSNEEEASPKSKEGSQEMSPSPSQENADKGALMTSPGSLSNDDQGIEPKTHDNESQQNQASQNFSATSTAPDLLTKSTAEDRRLESNISTACQSCDQSEDLPEEISQPPTQEVTGTENAQNHDVVMTNVVKPTELDSTSIFSVPSSRRSQRSAVSSSYSSFSTSKKGIKGGKAKYMQRPFTTSLIEPRIRNSSSNPSFLPPIVSPTSSRQSELADIRNFTPISSRHGFPRKNTFNSVVRSTTMIDELLSTN
ncbi:hypothetical protein C9374_005061 [Naegleria lovaniensis]|uniref:Uncharacterized protein n=1 Tax=Naegleria lovaniensis TaxID=51637 RepID=A0AA88GNM0_NAELO|nr:uncharacterized protein C9374_005061 [Naegleria lovaniensis]KAG2382481.1 hypothetical protein C9374_005061 [Naegleria lovaniensis]